MKELKERGIHIFPGDFGIIGFANELFGEHHITPALSTVDQQTVNG